MGTFGNPPFQGANDNTVTVKKKIQKGIQPAHKAQEKIHVYILPNRTFTEKTPGAIYSLPLSEPHRYHVCQEKILYYVPADSAHVFSLTQQTAQTDNGYLPNVSASAKGKHFYNFCPVDGAVISVNRNHSRFII